MRIAIVVGTRPEIIKMSPIIHECETQMLDYFVLHTGQHYALNLDGIFFQQLRLPAARYNLNVGSGTHGQETGRMLADLEEILLNERPDVVLVEGDTNSVLAGALSAAKLHMTVGHVEAGLRSYDRRMPEEINRVVADHVSDYLFAPTENARRTLLAEGIPEQRVFVTGNTIVDIVQDYLGRAEEPALLEALGLSKSGYFLATVHRQENVDVKARFAGIVRGLERVHQEFGMPVIYPMHPRAARRLKEFGLELPNGVRAIEPVGFVEFLGLESAAALVLTDSGGVQEETCIIGVPCVTLRDNTERPETLDVGSNVLAGARPDRIVWAAREMMGRRKSWANPFGDGKAGQRIVEIVVNRHGPSRRAQVHAGQVRPEVVALEAAGGREEQESRP